MSVCHHSEPAGTTPNPSSRPRSVFVATHWSVVLEACRDDPARALNALEHLCRAYWYPLYVYVRRRGYSVPDAEDLTQEFFARLLERNWLARADQAKGRLRTFLLHAMERFLANEWDKVRALKRGGGQKPLSLQLDTGETRYQGVASRLVCSLALVAAAGQAEKAIPPGALRQDLQTLVSTIERVHPDMFAYTPKEAFAARRAEVLEHLNRSMTPLEFFKLAAPFVTALRSGHTYVAMPGWTDHLNSDGRFYPFDIHWHGDEVILAHYYGEESLPLGGIIRTINGQPATDVLLELSHYFSAEDQEGNRFELERPTLLQQGLWSKFQNADLRLEIDTPQARRQSISIRAITLRQTLKVRMPHHDEGLFSCRYYPESQAAIIRIESFALEHRPSLKRFLARKFAEIQRRQVTSLILDLRDNGGGASLPVRQLLGYLTDRKIVLQENQSRWGQIFFPSRVGRLHPFEGRVFVLIGKRTASAAMGCAAAIRHNRLGTLVGEETTERMRFFGESRRFTLPHSRLTCVVASDRTVVVGGTEQQGGLKPAHEIKQQPEDTGRGVDTVLEFALKLTERRRPEKGCREIHSK
jgi:DNA-directed RNA polymerase specialized sigma24 family protein